MIFFHACLKLENVLGGEEIYKTHITKHLVPCIGQFAIAMGDDSQWKVLNYQILLKMRHSSPKVCMVNIKHRPQVMCQCVCVWYQFTKSIIKTVLLLLLF